MLPKGHVVAFLKLDLLPVKFVGFALARWKSKRNELVTFALDKADNILVTTDHASKNGTSKHACNDATRSRCL
jgi:hypothetical protein